MVVCSQPIGFWYIGCWWHQRMERHCWQPWTLNTLTFSWSESLHSIKILTFFDQFGARVFICILYSCKNGTISFKLKLWSANTVSCKKVQSPFSEARESSVLIFCSSFFFEPQYHSLTLSWRSLWQVFVSGASNRRQDYMWSVPETAWKAHRKSRHGLHHACYLWYS